MIERIDDQRRQNNRTIIISEQLFRAMRMTCVVVEKRMETFFPGFEPSTTKARSARLLLLSPPKYTEYTP